MRFRFDLVCRISLATFVLAIAHSSFPTASRAQQAPTMASSARCGVAGCWCMTGQAPAPASTMVAAGDPSGFTNWLNGVRARSGLAPVGYDPNLASWAAANNGQQQARGLGHYVMGPARRQNSAMGSAGSIGQMWLNSPAHRAAMLDPSVRWIGLAGMGMYWTLNLR